MTNSFISYSHHNKKTTKKLVNHIRRHYSRSTIWYDDETTGGQIWWDEILKQIANANIFIFLLSKNSLESPYCQAELQEATRLQKPMIFVKVARITNIPEEIRKYHIVDMTKLKKEEQLTELYRAIDYHSNTLITKQPLNDTQTPCPSGFSKQKNSRLSFLVIAVILSIIAFWLYKSVDPRDIADTILESDFFTTRSTFIRENNGQYSLYVVQNGEEVQVDAEQTGRKFYPILFDFNNNTILAYLLEREDKLTLRVINLDTNFDGDHNYLENRLPIEPTISKIAFIFPYIFYVGTDGVLYAHNFETNKTIEIIENVMNPSSINAGLIFQNVGDESGIYAWLNGNILSIETSYSDCHHPIARQSERSISLWAICDGKVRQIDLYNPATSITLDIDQNITEIASGQLATDIYIGDGNDIYQYRYNEENNSFEKTIVIGGSEQEKTLHLFVLTN